jgi:hypothetical protein
VQPERVGREGRVAGIDLDIELVVQVIKQLREGRLGGWAILDEQFLGTPSDPDAQRNYYEGSHRYYLILVSISVKQTSAVEMKYITNSTKTWKGSTLVLAYKSVVL